MANAPANVRTSAPKKVAAPTKPKPIAKRNFSVAVPAAAKPKPTPTPKRGTAGSPGTNTPPRSPLQDLLDALKSQADQQAAQQAAQRQALSDYTKNFLSYLSTLPGEVGGTYDNAINQADRLAQTAANGLANLNPGGETSYLSGVGAPDAQQAQIAAQNQQVFGGGGATLYDVAGKIPATALVGEKAGQMAFLQQLPGIEALAGKQALQALLSRQGSDTADLLAKQADMVQQAKAKLASLAATQNYKNAQLALSKQKLAAQTKLNNQKLLLSSQNQQFNQWAKTQGLSQSAARVDLTKQKMAQDAYFKQAGLNIRDQQLQLNIAKTQAKLSNKGYTQSQVIQFKKRAGKIAADAWNGKPAVQHNADGTKTYGTSHLTYQEAMAQGLAQGIPLTVMQQSLNRYWKKPGFTASWETPGSGEGRPMKNYQERTGRNPKNASSAGGAIGTALEFASHQIGLPYVFGAHSPGKAFDCSGLIYEAYKAAGVKIGRDTYHQIKEGKQVSLSQIQPGDLVFPSTHHVVMYVGNGKVIAAPHTGTDVQYQDLSLFGPNVMVRRIV